MGWGTHLHIQHFFAGWIIFSLTNCTAKGTNIEVLYSFFLPQQSDIIITYIHSYLLVVIIGTCTHTWNFSNIKFGKSKGRKQKSSSHLRISDSTKGVVSLHYTYITKSSLHNESQMFMKMFYLTFLGFVSPSLHNYTKGEKFL